MLIAVVHSAIGIVRRRDPGLLAWLRSALSYYALYPEEIEARIARNQDLTSEKVAKRFPFLARKAAAE